MIRWEKLYSKAVFISFQCSKSARALSEINKTQGIHSLVVGGLSRTASLRSSDLQPIYWDFFDSSQFSNPPQDFTRGESFAQRAENPQTTEICLKVLGAENFICARLFCA